MNPNLIAVENKIVRVLSIQPECFITHPTELAALKSMSPDELEEFALDNGWRASPGSADDKSSFTMTPGRAWLTRFRTQES